MLNELKLRNNSITNNLSVDFRLWTVESLKKTNEKSK